MILHQWLSERIFEPPIPPQTSRLLERREAVTGTISKPHQPVYVGSLAGVLPCSMLYSCCQVEQSRW
eukprot:3902447-Amphidinium_carterae.2